MNICIGRALKQAVEDYVAHRALLSHLSKGLNATVDKYRSKPKDPMKQEICGSQECVTELQALEMAFTLLVPGTSHIPLNI